MSKKTEQLQRDLEQAKYGKKAWESTKKSCVNTISSYNAEIASLEKQIAEDKKPVLKHGMVVARQYGGHCITVGNGKNAKNYDRRGNIIKQTVPGVSSYGVLCEDIFAHLDELKALQENVTEFTVASSVSDRAMRFSIKENSQVHIALDDRDRQVGLYLPLSEVVLMLRKLEATDRREQAKK